MKEFSVEEKAKRYDSMFERLKEMYNNNKTNVAHRLIYERYFPELKESEDERIRKSLLEYLHTLPNHYAHSGVCAPEWIAWLEKQCEQKPNFCHHEVDLSGCSEEYCKAYYDGWNNCNQQHSQLKAEQTLDWGEEDEKFVHGLIRGLVAKRDIHGHTTFSSDCIDITETINWLNSLKDRVQPQPKQEWSEEDEETFKDIITSMTNLKDSATSDALRYIYNSKIDWLKSLKERYTWKPSEGQMEALLWCVAHLGGADHRVLGELYEHLKKIKG